FLAPVLVYSNGRGNSLNATALAFFEILRDGRGVLTLISPVTPLIISLNEPDISMDGSGVSKLVLVVSLNKPDISTDGSGSPKLLLDGICNEPDISADGSGVSKLVLDSVVLVEDNTKTGCGVYKLILGGACNKPDIYMDGIGRPALTDPPSVIGPTYTLVSLPV